jgi:hypothetical protein
MERQAHIPLSQTTVINLAISTAAGAHLLMGLAGLAFLSLLGAELEALGGFVMVAVGLSVLPIMAAVPIGFFVHGIFPAPATSAKWIVRLLVWVFELSLWGWFLSMLI